MPGPNDSVICLLLGSTKPMPAERLAKLHPSRADFERRYDAAVEEAIDAGFVLAVTAPSLDGFAHADLIKGDGSSP